MMPTKCEHCGDMLPSYPATHNCGMGAAFAAPTGLAARVVVNQALVDEIIRRARASHWGLDEADKWPGMDVYADSDIDALAQCLVSSWTAKYDLVSVFSAAMSVIQEKAANEKAH